MDNYRSHILVCAGGGCVASGSLEVSAALREQLEKFGLSREVKVVETGCLGPCVVGPVAIVYPDGTFYQSIKPADAADIVQEHLLKGRPVTRLIYGAKPGEQPPAEALKELPFFRRQVKTVLRNCGMIDPQRIEEYIAREGYAGLAKALTAMTPDEVVDEVKRSGLRGRGGAGFPTGLKWALTRKAVGDVKYVLCNADEGDPGAFMDRSVLEGDPHSLIEGMCIAAYGIGARQGYVYVRAEYPLAVERLTTALEQAREYGLLGKDILGTGFDFDLEIRMGSGAFVCGEETALMTSIEGRRGEPRPRPPFPANKGLWGKPSSLNNVETFANVPVILLKGADWFASLGTAKSKGTKVFALAGAVTNTGLVEVPIGTSMGEIVYEIGGGVPGGKRFKAAQVGGPSGGCIPKQHLNVPLDYESLNELGAIMGSGGLVVMDEDSCMVDVARFFLDFVQEESCGKCTPCRIGTRRMLEIVTRICQGKGRMSDLDELVELGERIKDTALCGLGQSAPNPVLSTIRHFRDEYIAHIRDQRCPAGVCPDLVRAPCQNACPAGVDVPGFVSLVGEERYAEALRHHRERNPFASICARVCFHPCESKCRRAGLDHAVAIRGVKRFMVEQETTPQLPAIKDDPARARRRVAIVGGGPAGLACGYFLARLGYKPTVFEAEAQAGGMLVQTIPSYRLPRAELQREVRMIESLGVEIRTNSKLGRDFTLQGLRADGYEAVFLGLGAPAGSRLGVPGEDTLGVTEAIRYLREYNLHGAAPTGKRVVVVGGGNAAIDAARTALRLGAESVQLLYRRTRAEMPAWIEEIEEAEHEGLKMEFLIAPLEVVSEGGRVTGLKCQRMSLGEYDRTGRRRPVGVAGSEFVVPTDHVIAAIGQTLEPGAFLGDVQVELTRNGYLVADPVTGQTSVPWIFAGGDAATGPASVVDAVGTGEKAAVGIDQFLTGTSEPFWRVEHGVDTRFDPEADPIPDDRAEMPLLPIDERCGCFAEVELTFDKVTALREARRCLRCDYRCEEA